jgi:hypothetical protein
MNKWIAGNLLETESPQRHILSCAGVVRSSFEGAHRVPGAAYNNSLSIPVFRPKSSLFKGNFGRSQKEVIS